MIQAPSEAVQFAISMLTALYGPKSTQLKGFMAGSEMIAAQADGAANAAHHLLSHARGAIKNAKAELEAGLIVSLRVLVAGEILSELVRFGQGSAGKADGGHKECGSGFDCGCV